MKKFTPFLWLAVLLAAGAYAPFMRGYAARMTAPLPGTLTPPQKEALTSGFQPPSARFLHKVNTRYRARKKDALYPGFEIDILRHPNGNLVVAHDETELPYAVALPDLLAVIKNPAEKTYWLDLKTPLTDEDLRYLQQVAQHFHISPERFMFEAAPGPTAERLKKYGFSLLLQIPDGFDEDGNDPFQRARLNAQLTESLQKYQPQAVAGSFGKYKYLQAYFPHTRKAIYYSSTKRPSLKKRYLAQEMQKDPTVVIFMLDEYNF